MCRVYIVMRPRPAAVAAAHTSPARSAGYVAPGRTLRLVGLGFRV